jgi:hypothetical protein
MNEKRTRSGTSPKTEQVRRRRRDEPAEGGHDKAPGVQGANVGYWQAVGSTRAGVKRSKRP